MNIWVRAYLDEDRPGHVLICQKAYRLMLELPPEKLRKAEILVGRSCLVCDYYDLRWHPPYPREKLLELDPDEDLSWIDLSLE
ncbi:MAG: hypothetical protein HUU28_13555 [Planctomycetaceae bacterium]|nr:hypothetical protein [Planctomycetaceae bacterium]